MQLVTSRGDIISLLGEIKPHIRDIARSLSRISRYTGHSKTYSVAQHSVFVSELCPPQFAYQGLMHDAHEAITGDVSTPFKEVMEHHHPGWWRELEAHYAAKVRKHYGLPESLNGVVKDADRKAHQHEVAYLFSGRALKAWKSLGVVPDYTKTVTALDEEAAYLQFLTRYKQVSQGIGL